MVSSKARVVAAVIAIVLLTGTSTAGAETFVCDGSGDRVQTTNKTRSIDRNANGYVCEYQWWNTTHPDRKHTGYYDDSLRS